MDNPWNNGTDPDNKKGTKYLSWETNVFVDADTFQRRIEFYKELEATQPGYRKEDDWSVIEIEPSSP